MVMWWDQFSPSTESFYTTLNLRLRYQKPTVRTRALERSASPVWPPLQSVAFTLWSKHHQH